MALPPPPVNGGSSFAWNDWYNKLQAYVSELNLAHNSLTGLQGGTSNQYYHLTNAQYGKITYLDNVTGDIQAQINGKASITLVTNHTNDTGNPHLVTKAQVGLGSVDNTSDLAKPISTATQTALNLKAPLASPAFTTSIGFNGATAMTKPTITGSRGGNAALANLLTQLANYGLITDSTTA